MSTEALYPTPLAAFGLSPETAGTTAGSPAPPSPPYPYLLDINGGVVDDGLEYPGHHYYRMPANRGHALALAILADRLLVMDDNAFDSIDMTMWTLEDEPQPAERVGLEASGRLHSVGELCARLAKAFVAAAEAAGPAGCALLRHVQRESGDALKLAGH